MTQITKGSTPTRRNSDILVVAAYAVSFAMLAIMAAWIFVDPVVPWMLQGHTAEIHLRVVALATVVTIGAISSGYVLLRLVLGGTQDRSLRAMFVAVTLPAMWSGVFAAHERISWEGVMWQARRLVPGLKVDAAYLQEAWPSKDGALPFLGRFKFEYAGRRTLWIESWEYQMYTYMDVGPEVFRKRDHWICFIVGGGCGQIVYQPPDDSASNKLGGSRSPWHDEDPIFELEPNWYLIWERHIPSPPASATTCHWDNSRAMIVSP